MRHAHLLLLVALSAPGAVGAQRAATATTAAAKADSYSADSTSFVVGKRVYLRSTRTYIGTIIDANEQHDFRAGRFRRPWMKAVLIERRDGPNEWVPVEGITRIYVVR
jgi:hypothetical protein